MKKDLLRSDPALLPLSSLACTMPGGNPFECWTQRGRKGLIRESFFLNVLFKSVVSTHLPNECLRVTPHNKISEPSLPDYKLPFALDQ